MDQPDASLFLCPYDWRKPIRELADNLEVFIDSNIRPIFGNSNIDVIAHSMGGLVAKTYIKKHPDRQNIGRLFLRGYAAPGFSAIFQLLRYPKPTIPWIPYVLGYTARGLKEMARNIPRRLRALAQQDVFPGHRLYQGCSWIIDGNGFKRSSDEVLGYNQTLHFLKNARGDA